MGIRPVNERSPYYDQLRYLFTKVILCLSMDKKTSLPLMELDSASSIMTKPSQRVFSAVELCAGGGGSALGLEQAGFKHIALLDNNHYACATLRLNRPGWNVQEVDIQQFDSTDWRGLDLLTGGLPCPPFSIAGKQLGASDTRNMFPAMLRIVELLQPRAVLIENVRGIFTDRFAPFRAEINSALDAQGFETYWAGFDAADFGVPQLRFRVFLVALRRGDTNPLQWPAPAAGRVQTVSESIGDLMATGGWRGVEEWKKFASAPAPTIVGGSHKHGGPDLGPTRARQRWAAMGIDGLGIADEPPAADFIGMPRLTLAMVARLQSFPDDWIFSGSKTQAYRQVGNALPPKLAFAVARAVRKCLE
jgi:DNA (cytosine-5)-methyltransferase 1